MVEQWYSLDLGDGMMAAEPSAEIQDSFAKIFSVKGMPPEMAVFTRHESEGRLHCVVIAYFAPAASEIAQAFDAEPCPKPVRAGLALLAGNEQAWSSLFGETA